MAPPASSIAIVFQQRDILGLILSSISDIRSRNSASLVTHHLQQAERDTRTSLILRGNVMDIDHAPTCFTSVTHLDISNLSPWGHEIDSNRLSRYLMEFPNMTSLTVYARSADSLNVLRSLGNQLSHVKLIRWHNPSSSADLAPLFLYCQHALRSVDLSEFYYWTEEFPPLLKAYPQVFASLTSLNLLSRSMLDGFRSHKILEITAACPNLTTFQVLCLFDPSYSNFLGDKELLAIAANCRGLKVLHLVDPSSLSTNDQGFTDVDAMISGVGLMDFFAGLPLLEEIVLDVSNNVRDTSFAIEILHSKCPRLKVLKLGCFHGICLPIEPQLHGVALFSGLQSLSIKKSADLTDEGLQKIGRGCSRLTKFEVDGCDKITRDGMGSMVTLLQRTLIDVSISCCQNLHVAASLQALASIKDRIERLHIDCAWSEVRRSATDGFWRKLKYLSVVFRVGGGLLSSLPAAGLVRCDVLKEIKIKVKGDSRGRRPPVGDFGLGSLMSHVTLSKMELDCGDTIGFSLTAPTGDSELSRWERFFLLGIHQLPLLYQLDYWPPQDYDLNRRSLSFPAAALLARCVTLRKLFIHGTASQHLMEVVLGRPDPNFRDVQLRQDYYLAPDEMSTEMRASSCIRIEDAVKRLMIAD